MPKKNQPAVPHLTLTNAPRDVEGLKKYTAFEQRVLLTSLGGMQTQEQMMFWKLSTSDVHAVIILTHLLMHDAQQAAEKKKT